MNHWIFRLHPLAKLVAILPCLVLISLQNGGMIYPIIFGSMSMVLLFSCVPLSRLRWVILPLLITLILHFVFYPLFLKKSLVGDSSIVFSIGRLVYRKQALLRALMAAVRIFAMYMLSLFLVASTNPEDFPMVFMQNLRIPYRFGFVVLAMLRFLPLFYRELQTILLAQQVRGTPKGLQFKRFFFRLRRRTVLLLVGAIRRAERMALSWESRAFGFRPTRTYMNPIKFSYVNVLFVLCFWGIGLFLKWIALVFYTGKL